MRTTNSVSLLALPLAWAFLQNANAQSYSAAGSARIAQLFQDRQPTWTGGVLVSIENNHSATPVIHTFDQNGQELQPMAFALPGAKLAHILGACRGIDGAMALVGRAFDQQGREGGFITWVSPDRQTIRTIRPAPYLPTLVTIPPDGSIWTVGFEAGANEDERDPGVNLSHGVIRHFETNGNQIGSFLPRSKVFGGKWPTFDGGILVSSADRIGWYLRFPQQYYEVTFSGKATFYPNGVATPPSRSRVWGLAIMADNQVFAEASGENGNQLFKLDRRNGVWLAVSAPVGTSVALSGNPGRVSGPELLGGDGSRLVFRGYDPGDYQIKFFNVGASQ